MELLTQLNELHVLQIIFLVAGLIVALFVFFANWLYLMRTRSSAHLIDLHPPANIDHLLKTSMAISLVTIICIIGIFVTRVY